MSFKAHLSTGGKLRFIKLALQILGKIGAELLIEALPHQLVLRSINSSRSAYAAVIFHQQNQRFFSAYDTFGNQVVQAGIVLKQALALFRAHRVSKTTLELLAAENKLAFTLVSENGLQKQYKVPCMDSEILQASIDEEAFPVLLVAEAKELSRLLGSFQATLEEVTLIALPPEQAPAAKAVQIHSFNDPAKGQERSLRTQIEVDAAKAFVHYEHHGPEPADVTFNLKDFRAMVSLCEALSANVAIRFDGPGSPVVVKPHYRGGQETDFSAVLVLATLRTSQIEAVAAARDSARTHQAGRTPNIPGDTPWTRAAQNGHANGSAQQAGPRSHVPPRPSRFGASAVGPAAPQQAHPQNGGLGVTPIRLPPFPGPRPEPQQRLPQDPAQGAGPEEPGSAARPSAAVTLPPSGSMRPSAPGSARPSARMFDTEQEFANDDLLDGQQWQADEAADDAPRQSADGQPNGLPEQPTGSRPAEEAEPRWHDLSQPPELAGSMRALGVEEAQTNGLHSQAPAPLRSRYRALMDEDEHDSEDSEMLPATPKDPD